MRTIFERPTDPGPVSHMAPGQPLDRILLDIKDEMGFLSDIQLSRLADLDRLRPVLVRCGRGRFTCAAQDAEHFIAIIERDGSDYIRDVSLLSSDPVFSS